MTAPATPTPPQYVTGWVKVDAANTKAVAVRTDIATSNNLKDWGVMTVDHGGHYATWDDVAGWSDLAVPTVVTSPFGGDGALSATVGITEEAVLPAFTGAGTLSATVGIIEEGVLAAFTGAGALGATVTSQRRTRKKT
jgi:hypothetical protein